jgi:hypothetical protein
MATKEGHWMAMAHFLARKWGEGKGEGGGEQSERERQSRVRSAEVGAWQGT